MIEVIPVEWTERARAVEALARAFHDDPMWSCILPDPETRPAAFRPMWNALVGFARVYGAAYTTPDGEGACCWIAPGNTKTTIWKVLRTGMALPRSMMRLSKGARERFFAMMRFIDERHGRLMSGPHWYLWALGVAPEAQGRGIGGALLRPVLERADLGGVPCYLETQSEGNVAFYRKRGFEVVEEGREPVGDLLVWFMIRSPRRDAG